MVHVMIPVLQIIVIAHTQEITERFCGLLDAHIQRTNAKEPEILFCKANKTNESDALKCEQIYYKRSAHLTFD